MIKKFHARVKSTSREFRLFLSAILLGAFGGSLVDAVFNNFLNDTFSLNGFQRTFLELPREAPGFLVVFVSALLFFVCPRRLAALAMLFASAGLFLIAFFSSSLNMMLVWLFVFSLGQHVFIPLNSNITMELAKAGETGKRLGQFNGARNFAAILGSFAVFTGFKYLHLSYKVSFIIAGIAFLGAFFLLLGLQKDKPKPASLHLKLHKEYRLYYWLCILFGTRKQIFLTFAPWVLVTVYHKPTQTVATLLMMGGVLGIVFQPLLGKAIDRLGERAILAAEAFILIFVCTGYGIAKNVFPPAVAFVVVAACYLTDQLLMSVGMARSMYIKRIAKHPSHVAPTLTMATTIDHIFSISTALLCGLLWSKLGYTCVFLLGACIAVVNLFSALRIRDAEPVAIAGENPQEKVEYA